MSLVEEFHEAHKARLARMGGARIKRVISNPSWRGVDPEPFYPQMWMWGLVRQRGVVGDYIPPIKKIKHVVSAHYGVGIIEMDSPRRQASVVLPRQVVMYLAKKLTRLSYPMIGRQLGGRDHSTVISGVRRIEHYLKQHPTMAVTLDKLEQEIMTL